jgi:hypothetical protein
MKTKEILNLSSTPLDENYKDEKFGNSEQLAQQTAVEELEKEILRPSNGMTLLSNGYIKELFAKAKEKDKEQKKYFFDCGRQYQLTGEGTFTQVYNETYKSE